MVRVCKCLSNNRPCRIPAEVVFVHQKAHQFGDCYDGVRVVQLDNIIAREVGEIRTVFMDKRTH